MTAKSEVVEGRVEISKYESEQMNSSAAWFQRNYPGSSSRNILVHPAKALNAASAFLQDVDVMRRKDLERLGANLRKFFAEFKNVDLKDLSPEHVQRLLDLHELGVQDLLTKYGEKPRTRASTR